MSGKYIHTAKSDFTPYLKGFFVIHPSDSDCGDWTFSDFRVHS
jgi:hypothetical protein